MANLKVLIVEDDETARRMLVKFIQKEDFDVVEADDAAVGIQMIDKELPDLVISDFKMPKGNGLDIIRHAKKANPLCQTILITAFGELDTAILALREGVLDYLKKPLDLDALSLALGRGRARLNELKNFEALPTLLIVEDDADARKMLVKAMSKEGWRVEEAENGDAALVKFKQKKFDIVVLDIRMPGKDGLTTLAEMRDLSKDFEAIVVTGYGDEQSVLHALKNGAINFVKKPVDIEQLEVFLRKAMMALSLKRAIRYRTRDLELAQHVIARIATREGVVVDLVAADEHISRGLVAAILDHVPMGLIVVNGNKEIRYANKPVAVAVQGSQLKIDASFVQGLEKLGIKDLPLNTLTEAIDKALSSEANVMETLKVGQWAYINLVKLVLVQNEVREDVVLILTRGERS